ncbi:MAG: flagellar biosynthesis protein FlhB [Chromatiales bacterium]|jgi:flagellar biosynthetic protein FlhB
MAAENQDGQEKTEQATPKRQDKARKKGQVPRSKDLANSMFMVIAVVTLMMTEGVISDGFDSIFKLNFQLAREDVFDTSALVRNLADSIVMSLKLVAPFFAVMIVVAFLSNVPMGGFIFSMEPMKPKLEKFNILKGMKKFVSVNGLMELGKSFLKFVLIGGATYFLLAANIEDFLTLADMDPEDAEGKMLSLISWLVLIISSTLILIALFDVPYQKWKYKENLKMTKQEVKDENKSQENPEIRRRIRQTQFDSHNKRMMEAVPSADVVITNPTHFAVALRYDQDEMAAPVVVAKGADLLAASIRRVAEEHEITIVESPPLARAIYFTTKLDQPIPSALYLAVAKLLAYVYELQASPFDIRDDDRVRDQWQVPDEMQFDTRGRKTRRRPQV